MEKFTHFSGKFIALPIENIDTDQIIPAQFLKVTGKSGLGKNLFFHWRYRPDGTPNPDFILNRPQAAGAHILVAGDNFGCGSSREHAPWALLGAGFRVVISTRFADIFRNNALKNGLLPVEVDAETHRQLLSLADEDPDAALAVDLSRQTITLPDGRTVRFPIDPFSKTCIVQGVDSLGYLQRHAGAIAAYEAAHPPRVDTLS
ncbi:MAG: 3-isopropylmalate dehydratase small subunit [Anaerolineae bacterium]